MLKDMPHDDCVVATGLWGELTRHNVETQRLPARIGGSGTEFESLDLEAVVSEVPKKIAPGAPNLRDDRRIGMVPADKNRVAPRHPFSGTIHGDLVLQVSLLSVLHHEVALGIVPLELSL